MARPAAPARGGGDLSIQMPAAAADPAGGESQQSGRAAAKPEKRFNCFVRILATIELVGNALGTLASLWASLVLIGGYRNSLDHVDFWIATIMIFIEAFRVFIRNFKLDHQSLFGTTKALRGISSSLARMLWRPREGNEVLLIISWLITIFNPLTTMLGEIGSLCQMVGLALMSRMIQLKEAPRLIRQLRKKKPRLLWLVLIIMPPGICVIAVLIRLLILWAVGATDALADPLILLLAAALDKLAGILPQAVALVLLSLRPRCITTLTRSRWGRWILYASKVISVLVLPFGAERAIAFTTVVLLFASLQDPAIANKQFGRWIDVIMNICFLWALLLPIPILDNSDHSLSDFILLPLLLIGNLQIPAAITQIVLSAWRLHSLQGDGPNMKASIRVFFGLELCQGSLYIVACILALFSFFPRRWLLRRSGFTGKWGAKAVNLYYEGAYKTRMETGVFEEDTISLASFALDSLSSTTSTSTTSSSAREKQLAGVRVLHSLLQLSDDSRKEIISVITKSEKAVPKLISMLAWTFEDDREIRLFAARVTAKLSDDLIITGIPGAVKLVSSLLDAEKQPTSENNEGDGDDGPLAPHADGDNQIGGSTEIELVRRDILPEVGNVNGDNVDNMELESSGNGEDANNQPQHRREGNNNGPWWSWICQCWPLMKKKWSIPDECPMTYQDSSLRILGLEILQRLACDTDNCAEIIKVRNLVPKIIGLTSYSSSESNIEIDSALISSALNLLRRFATTNGKIGATLRQELWESPFLVSNLACILEDSRSSPKEWKSAMDIIAILSWDENARHELGSIQEIIRKLVHVFVSKTTIYDQSLRMAAGEALTNLSIESTENCLAILEERGPGYELVKDLKDMLGNDEYRCIASSLLHNLCACYRIRDRLRDQGAISHLSSTLPVVLENIENIRIEDGKQLEALVGLASQIYYVLAPQPFAQGLESRVIGATCVQKLVDTLNSNKKPSHEYPRMRRAIVEMVISVLECYPHHCAIFRTNEMKSALSKVEMTPSKVEKYKVFLGNDGVVLERGLPLRERVARARELIDSATLPPCLFSHP